MVQVLRRRTPSAAPPVQAKPAKAADEIDELPPRVPEAIAELDEAAMMLGHYVKGPVHRVATRRRAYELLGREPFSSAEATAWKGAIKAYRKELVELDKE